MAESPNRSRKHRIRQSAPTIRQRAEAAQAQPKDGSKRTKILRTKATRPLKRLRPPSNRLTRRLAGIIRFIVPSYFIKSWQEVRQVAWPSRRETWRLTGAVFIFAIIFGAMVAVVDKGLDEIFKKVVLK